MRIILGSLLAATALGAAAGAQAPAASAVGSMSDLMVKMIYPTSDAIFYITTREPKTEADWGELQAKALTLAESANLLTIPGRICSNGAPVPVKDAAWAAFVQQLRNGSMQAYQAAKTKDQDKMIDASNAVNASCEGCHRKWRSPRTPANRCK